MTFEIGTSGPGQKIHFHHLPQKGKAVFRITPAKPQQKGRKDRKQEKPPLLCLEPEQFSRSQQIQAADSRYHSRMPAFRQKSQGEQQAAEVQPFMVFPDPQHRKNCQGEKQHIKGVRVTCPGKMGGKRALVGTEKAQDQDRGLSAVPLRE